MEDISIIELKLPGCVKAVTITSGKEYKIFLNSLHEGKQREEILKEELNKISIMEKIK